MRLTVALLATGVVAFASGAGAAQPIEIAPARRR